VRDLLREEGFTGMKEKEFNKDRQDLQDKNRGFYTILPLAICVKLFLKG
jgi:hypothetical protein